MVPWLVLGEDQGEYYDQTTTNTLAGGRADIDFNVEYSDWIVEHHTSHNNNKNMIMQIGNFL